MGFEENKALFIEAVNRQDWRRFDELVDPDFVRQRGLNGIRWRASSSSGR